MSLRWKTGLFLFALLLAITMAFVLREQAEIEQHYEALRHEILSRQVTLSEEAIRQTFTQLTATANTTAQRADVRNLLSGHQSKGLDGSLEDYWSMLQVNIGASLLIVQDRTGGIIKEMSNRTGHYQQPLSAAVLAHFSRNSLAVEHPHTHAACAEQCLLYVWAPILDQGKAIGTVLMAVPLTESLLSFYRVIRSNAGIVMPTSTAAGQGHSLPGGESIIAMTGGDQAWRAMAQVRPTWIDSGGSFRWQSVMVDSEHFEVARWPVKVNDQTLPASFVAMMNVDHAYAERRSAFLGSIGSGICLFLVAIIFSLLLTRRMLIRLQMCGEAIELLGQRSYDASRMKLRILAGKHRSQDEIGKINRITFTVAERLEAMERESSTHEAALTNIVQNLEREKALVAELLNTAPFHIIVHNESGQIILANRFAAELKKTSLSALLVRPFVPTFFDPADIATSTTLISHLLADGQTRQQETSLTLVNGDRCELLWLHCRMQLADSERPLVLSIGQDVTALKQSEAKREHYRLQFQQAQKMEAIGQLTGGIAHDFNNILASILGYTELAMSRVDGTDNKLPRYLNEVKIAGERARDLIAQMLAFSRGSDSEQRQLPLEPLIKEVVKLLRPLFPTAMVLRTDIGRVPPVTANPVQLQQILMNLAINARDATNHRGNVTIRLRHQPVHGAVCASCHSRIDGEFVALSVSDDGDGIAAEHLSRIFDPFFTTKEIGKGTGMGLSIVHGLTHDFAGHVQVSSTPGVGTTFTILLPIVASTDTLGLPRENTSQPQDIFHGCRLLIVDDEGSITRFVGELMETRGIVVTLETDSSRALARFNATPDSFDLVLSDLTMPKLSGVELAIAMRQRRPDLPIIIWSGYWDEGLLDTAIAAGISATLNKPVQVNLLWETLARLCPGNGKRRLL